MPLEDFKKQDSQYVVLYRPGVYFAKRIWNIDERQVRKLFLPRVTLVLHSWLEIQDSVGHYTIF